MATKSFPHKKRSPQYGVQQPGQPQSRDFRFPPPDGNQDFFGRDRMQRRVSGKYNVALLVPLSGAAAKAGESIFDATQMAIFENPASDIVITPYDTQGTPEGAAEATYAAISEGTDLILGPLFGASIRQVAPIARTENIKVISFSNDKAAAGNGVYTLGLIPEQQVKRVIQYAARRGIKGFSGIVPNDKFGHEVKKVLKDNVAWAGKDLRKTEVYSSTQPRFNKAVAELIEEYNGGEKKNKPKVRLSYETEAIMIPQGGEALERLLIALQQEGITSEDVQILGTSLWDNEDTLSIPELTNAWYASVPYDGVDRFMSNFTASFGYRPKNVASLGYDAANLAVILSESNFSDAAINDPQGFVGANGLYRFNGKGINERAYEILEISNGQILVVDPAPYNF